MLSASSAKKYKVNDEFNHVITDEVITLDGIGVPYLLDALTGEITQVGEYTDNGDGTLSIMLDELPAGVSKIIAISSDTTHFPAAASFVTAVDKDAADYDIVRGDSGEAVLRADKSGEYQVTLSGGDSIAAAAGQDAAATDLSEGTWNLTIDSYGPTYKDARLMVDERGIQTVDPSDTTITTWEVGEVALGNWADLAVSAEQLAELGVEEVTQIAGRGYYTTTFDWDGSRANLKLAYGNDQITGLTINGTRIGKVNNLTDTVDLGDYLVAGENTLEIELSTTLAKRAKYEHDMLRNSDGLYFGTEFYTTNGLTSAVLTTYEDVELK